jgi:hypothetical protein
MFETGYRALVSRRLAVGLAAGGVGLGLGIRSTPVRAVAIDMASHPIVGTWLTGRASNDIDVTLWSADGSMVVSGNLLAVGQDGSVGFTNIPMGTWEPVDEYGIHFTFTVANFSATGEYTGTGTVDGYPVVSDDGTQFWDDGSKVMITVRDATGAVVQTIGGDGSVPGIGGVKMAPGKAGYDELLAAMASRGTATPTS